MSEPEMEYIITEEQLQRIEKADMYTTKIIGDLTSLAEYIRSRPHPAPALPTMNSTELLLIAHDITENKENKPRYLVYEDELSYLESVFDSQFKRPGEYGWRSPSNAMTCFEITTKRIRSRTFEEGKYVDRVEVLKALALLQAGGK